MKYLLEIGIKNGIFSGARAHALRTATPTRQILRFET